jgi:ATP-dependent RNA helicase DDX49/DBP8
MLIPSTVRDAYLVQLLRSEFESKTIIIFTGSCKSAERLRIMLRELEVDSTALHSLMSQKDRIASLARFKGGMVKVLISTDVGSRYTFILNPSPPQKNRIVSGM